MNASRDRVTPHREDVNLVDVAAIFVRRRYAFYGCVVVLTLLGLVYAIMTSNKYEYVTLIQIAEKGEGEFIESPAVTVATLNNRWIPDAMMPSDGDGAKELPFRLQTSSLEGTGLVSILSETAVSHQKRVEEVHRTLASKVLEKQKRLLKLSENRLNAQLSSLDSLIESLSAIGGGESSGTALAAAIQKRSELQGQLDSLEEAELLVVARQSHEKTAPARTLIVILSGMLGCMLGVLLAFFWEFVIRVRDRLAEEER